MAQKSWRLLLKWRHKHHISKMVRVHRETYHHVFKMEGKLEIKSLYRIWATWWRGLDHTSNNKERRPSRAGPKTRFSKKRVSLAWVPCPFYFITGIPLLFNGLPAFLFAAANHEWVLFHIPCRHDCCLVPLWHHNIWVIVSTVYDLSPALHFCCSHKLRFFQQLSHIFVSFSPMSVILISWIIVKVTQSTGFQSKVRIHGHIFYMGLSLCSSLWVKTAVMLLLCDLVASMENERP